MHKYINTQMEFSDMFIPHFYCTNIPTHGTRLMGLYLPSPCWPTYNIGYSPVIWDDTKITSIVSLSILGQIPSCPEDFYQNIKHHLLYTNLLQYLNKLLNLTIIFFSLLRMCKVLVNSSGSTHKSLPQPQANLPFAQLACYF